jgi:photosystem II stability/assembly factor-like uncharacterized protein
MIARYNHVAMRWLALILAAAAQTPAPPEVSKPAAESTAKPAVESAEKPVLENTGKPMRISSACGDEEIQALGLTCSADEPCSLYLELTAVEVVGARIFISGNVHTDTTTLHSILLASPDAGKTWQEPYDRIRSAALDQLQFVDLETGWVAGQMLQAIPRDPFFLLTTDGGKSWRRRDVFSESRPGSLEQFFFESRSNGSAVTRSSGRYELYATMTGGESWMIREVSPSPLTLKNKLVHNADWRLRAHAPTKSFRVEQRQGGKWAPVASFLVAAGACIPREAAPSEPPPEPEAAPQPETVPERDAAPSRRTPAKKPSLRDPKK